MAQNFMTGNAMTDGQTWRKGLRFGVIGAFACVSGALIGQLFVSPSEPVTEPQGDVAIVLLLDTSGSMQGTKIREVQQAARQFVEDQDYSQSEVALVSFDDTATTRRQLSRTAAPLVRSINLLSAGGGTNMSDGLKRAESLLRTSRAPRKAILLFTDGVPNSEFATRSAAISIRQNGTVIVAVATSDSNRRLLEVVTGNPDFVISTQLGNFGAAFARGGQIINSGVVGTESRTEGLQIIALVALLLGAALLLAENVLSLRGRWFRDLWWVPLGAALLGLAGGALAEGIYLFFGGTRAVGWLLFGGAVGAVLGLADRSRPKALRGAVGGAVGGFVGGLMFEAIFGLGDGGAVAGVVSRVTSFGVLGFAIGMSILLAQEFAKNAWLMGITTNAYEGKRYILASSPVTVGRSDGNDIGLYREGDLPLNAGRFVRESEGWFFEAVGQGSAVKVNGRVVARAPLTHSDIISLGSSDFRFFVRGGESDTVADRPWQLCGDTDDYALPHQPTLSLGSGAGNDVRLSGSGIATTHAHLRFGARGVHLVVKATPTTVNDQPVAVGETRELERGDLIRLGDHDYALALRPSPQG
ncbi:MAG: VWA domain-containing protein [Trueperaceae bacterium]|nr:VWA domain-containing protein [Trueperaceae bacterium]